MLKQERNRTKVCNTCRSAACTVYCRADSAYLCATCDAQVHAANLLASRHERVRVCEACERAPAAFFCKADAASLCIACDSQVHLANPLARRHQRVPILPVSSMATNHSSETTAMTDPENIVVMGQEEEDETEVASWLLPSSEKNNNNSLDLVDCQQDYNVVPRSRYARDGVVPLQVEESKAHVHHEQHNFQFGFTNVSSGCHMVSLVLESTSSDTTVLLHSPSPKAATDQLPDPSIQIFSPGEREARVMRYREKKKTRKFEKRVRYASRKAYAETRPRIKGRFVKREEVDAEAEADQGFPTMIMFNTGYGVVPSL